MTLRYMYDLRGGVKCMGQNTCFPLAFGAISISVFVAAFVFMIGRCSYRIERKRRENLIWLAFKCICYALCAKWTDQRRPQHSKMTNQQKSCDSKTTNQKHVCNEDCCSGPRHWLDKAKFKYGATLIDDVKRCLKLSRLFLPMIPFWALYFQIGSTFVIQGSLMNGRLGQLTILPDQLITLSSIFSLILVLMQQLVIFPLLTKCSFNLSPLKRMGCGICLAVASFVIAGCIQMRLERKAIVLPSADHFRHTFLNLAHCQVRVRHAANLSTLSLAHDQMITADVQSHQHESLEISCYGNRSRPSAEENLTLADSDNVKNRTNGKFSVLWHDLKRTTILYPLKKTASGFSKLYFAFHPSMLENANFSVIVKQKGKGQEKQQRVKLGVDKILNSDNFVRVKPPLYGSNIFHIYIENCTSRAHYEFSGRANTHCDTQFLSKFKATSGSSSVLTINDKMITRTVELVEPNKVNLMWQIPQYCLLAGADTMVSIAGAEFSYTEASPNMKSLLQGVRLLTTMFGNLLEMALGASGLTEDNPLLEFFGWAAVMSSAFILFCLLANKYEYVNVDDSQSSAIKDRSLDRRADKNGTLKNGLHEIESREKPIDKNCIFITKC